MSGSLLGEVELRTPRDAARSRSVCCEGRGPLRSGCWRGMGGMDCVDLGDLRGRAMVVVVVVCVVLCVCRCLVYSR